MSEWYVKTVTIGEVREHPNADRLGITDVEGNPIIVGKETFKTGDTAVFVPVDSVMPDTPENVSLFGKSRRVRSKKIRNVFSRGFLIPSSALPENILSLPLGTVVHEQLGISKYEPPAEKMMSSGRTESPPKHFLFPEYTDLESMRKWQSLWEEDGVATREVVITEKVHGSNARFCHDGERLWVGSRTQVKAKDTPLYPGHQPKKTWWWAVAEKLDLENRLSAFPFTVFYGEVYGRGVQDLTYGSDINFRIFDTLDARTGAYNDWDVTKEIVASAGLELVPELYRGPWGGLDAHRELAEGPTTMGGVHVREGFVVKPAHERWNPTMGRMILKFIGEGYELR